LRIQLLFGTGVALSGHCCCWYCLQAEDQAREVSEATAGELVDAGEEESQFAGGVEEQKMADNQTLLESVANGSRHSLAVRD